MKEEISIIKPKAISQDSSAYFVNNVCILDFGRTKVYKRIESMIMPTSWIPVKELFSDNLDAAKTITEGYPDVYVEFGGWEKVPINQLDASVFNSIGAAGKEAYWDGAFSICEDELWLDAKGLLYSARYVIPKTLTLKASFMVSMPWEAFYYLYVLFKDVTAKKLGTLKYFQTTDIIVFTDEDETFYIEVRNGMQQSTQDVLSNFNRAINNAEWYGTKSVSKKLLTANSDSLVKHLYKPFKDTIEICESEKLVKYSDALYYVLCVTKEKL